MRRKFLLPTVAATLALGVSGASTASAGHPGTNNNKVNDCAARNGRGHDLQVVGLVADGTLVCFQDDRPGRADTIGRCVGLDQDTSLVGIDYRPANSVLYGLGNAGGVYTIDANTAEAKLVSRLNQPLQGKSFGVDFNPTVDRLRIVSDTGQNLRVNVDDGTTNVDGTLNIPGPTPVNPALGVTARRPTRTTTPTRTRRPRCSTSTRPTTTPSIQAPPNAGSLNPTGKLGVDAAGRSASTSTATLGNGTTVGLRPLASIATPDGTPACTRSTCSPAVSPRSARSVPVVDIAIPTDQR